MEEEEEEEDEDYVPDKGDVEATAEEKAELPEILEEADHFLRSSSPKAFHPWSGWNGVENIKISYKENVIALRVSMFKFLIRAINSETYWICLFWNQFFPVVKPNVKNLKVVLTK